MAWPPSIDEGESSEGDKIAAGEVRAALTRHDDEAASRGLERARRSRFAL